MKALFRLLVPALVATFALMATPARAQTQIATLDELRRSLTPGDAIVIVQVSGESINGTLILFGDRDLEIRVEVQPHPNEPRTIQRVTIPLGSIRTLERRAAPAVRFDAVPTRFDQFEKVARPGTRVTLTDTAGNEVTGKIRTLSASTLTLMVEGRPVNFAEADVALIRQRQGDSLVNGALIGAVSGFAPIAIMGMAEESGGESCDFCFAAALASGAVGAAIGIGVDAAIRKLAPIYLGQASASPTVKLAPILRPGSKGLLVTLRF